MNMGDKGLELSRKEGLPGVLYGKWCELKTVRLTLRLENNSG